MADDGDRFIQYLAERHDGEVYGEAVFQAMAEHTAEPEARWRWRVLEALERETKELLGRELRARARAPGERAGVERGADPGQDAAHERATLEMIDLEIANPAADPTGPVRKLLASTPAR